MDSFILGYGKLIPAHEVFDTWISNDLKRMLAVLNKKTHPADRHHWLKNLVVLLKPMFNI